LECGLIDVSELFSPDRVHFSVKYLAIVFFFFFWPEFPLFRTVIRFCGVSPSSFWRNHPEGIVRICLILLRPPSCFLGLFRICATFSFGAFFCPSHSTKNGFVFGISSPCSWTLQATAGVFFLLPLRKRVFFSPFLNSFLLPYSRSTLTLRSSFCFFTEAPLQNFFPVRGVDFFS